MASTCAPEWKGTAKSCLQNPKGTMSMAVRTIKRPLFLSDEKRVWPCMLCRGVSAWPDPAHESHVRVDAYNPRQTRALNRYCDWLRVYRHWLLKVRSIFPYFVQITEQGLGIKNPCQTCALNRNWDWLRVCRHRLLKVRSIFPYFVQITEQGLGIKNPCQTCALNMYWDWLRVCRHWLLKVRSIFLCFVQIPEQGFGIKNPCQCQTCALNRYWDWLRLTCVSTPTSESQKYLSLLRADNWARFWASRTPARHVPWTGTAIGYVCIDTDFWKSEVSFPTSCR